MTAHLQAMHKIADQTLRARKNISLGSGRPCWTTWGGGVGGELFTADFSGRTGDGEVGRLNEPHRTCVFRVVQESLTNCGRQSQAKRVSVLSGGS